jgi:hypothetical protein
MPDQPFSLVSLFSLSSLISLINRTKAIGQYSFPQQSAGICAGQDCRILKAA